MTEVNLNLDKVKNTVTLGQGPAIVAVIMYHNELPKNENGVATITLRELIEMQVPMCTGLLREYVCAFGAHGEAVIRRHFTKIGANMEDFNAEVNKNLSEIKQKINALTTR